MSEAASRSATPAEVRIYVSTGQGMEIVWADGHRSHYAFDYLRERCPCAVCQEERKRRAPVGPGLPLYRPRVTARSAGAVGHYAVEFAFSDGHSAGIFTFAYLREICPCADCRGRPAATGPGF